jgi:hypothetical protein
MIVNKNKLEALDREIVGHLPKDALFMGDDNRELYKKTGDGNRPCSEMEVVTGAIPGMPLRILSNSLVYVVSENDVINFPGLEAGG